MLLHANPLRRRAKEFNTTFGEYPLGAQLKDHGWTEHGAAGGTLTDGDYEIVSDPDSISGQAVHVTQGGVDQYRCVTWDKVGLVTNFEILALIKLVELPNAIGGGGLCCLVGGNDGYDAVFDDTAVGGKLDSFHVSQFTNGFFDNIVGGINGGIDLNLTDQFYLRFKRSNNQLSIKAWNRNTPEPVWLTGTDTTYSAAGALGIQTVERRDFRVYLFSATVRD
jgi:hypothetical protein